MRFTSTVFAAVVTSLACAASGFPVAAQSLRKEASRVRIDPPPSAVVPADEIGVERYLNIRGATAPDWSPSGRWIAFLSAITGQNQVWRVSAAGGWPEQVTFGNEAVGTFAWSPADENVIAFTRDVGGNERDQIFVADLATGALRRLTTGDNVIHNFGGWSRDGRHIAYAANARKPESFDLYVLDVDSGSERLVFQKDGTLSGRGFSPDGRSYIAVESRSSFDQDLWWVDLAGGAEPRRLAAGPGPSRFGEVTWEPRGTGIYVRTNQGRDFEYVARCDARSGLLQPILDSTWDIETHAVSRNFLRMAAVANEDGYSKLQVHDLASHGPTTALRLPFLPAGVVTGLVWSGDGQSLAFSLAGPTHPSDIWVWSMRTRSFRQVTHSSTAGMPASTFIASELVHYPTFDGRMISAFLYRPAGSKGRPIPVIVNVHGGPEEQSRATFSALTQYFLRRGFGVLYPNVRGSTGFGKAFEHLDDVDKRLDAVRDLAAAATWLAQSGIAPANRIAVSGGSYGGYMALAGLAFHPELWACGVSTVGISNLRTFIANTGAWRRALRAAEYGDPDKDAAAMDAASPLLHADRITAPLFVIQGANDPRVPKSESDQIVAAVRARGGAAEYMLFEDEGHGLDKLDNRVKAYTAMADFMERYLLAPTPPAP